METVCHGKQWDVALAYAPNGDIIAAMPYLIGRKAGLRYVLQPQLTQYNGPWYRPGTDVSAAAQHLQEEICRLRLFLFLQNFAPRTPHASAWEKYAFKERVSYRIEDISNLDKVFQDFDKSRRQRQIRRTEKLLHPKDITAEDFATFHAAYWQARGEEDLLSHDFMVRVIDTAQQRNQGILLGLEDNDGTLRAARFVVFDDHCAYSLLSALHPQHPNGASALLFWLIIQQLSGKTTCFDFEGSMDPNIAFSYSLYGAHPVTYYQVSRCKIPPLQRLLTKK